VSRSPEIKTCYVCVNLSCAEGGSQAIATNLAERLAGTDVAVKTQICFGACWMGPNIVLHPNGTWYSNVQLGDLDEIVAHIQGGAPVDRLIDKVDPTLHELVISILDAGLD
jgi:(2Fe-2S) ferredoxin